MTTEQIEVYTSQRRCIKCNTLGTNDKYNPIKGFGSTTLEIIRRECINCGYTWDELPLDHPLATSLHKMQYPANKVDLSPTPGRRCPKY